MRSSVLVLLGVASLAVFLPQQRSQASAGDHHHNGPVHEPCPIEPEARTVRGTSLEPLLHAGDTITLLRGYYACHPVERHDVVAYRYAGNRDPIIKMVKGLAGDTFTLRPTADGARWQIVVNGEVVTTSEGVPYTLDPHRSHLLALYVRDYHGVIPPQACLLLGNRPEGSLDSTRFGLVGQSDLIGKVQ